MSSKTTRSADPETKHRKDRSRERDRIIPLPREKLPSSVKHQTSRSPRRSPNRERRSGDDSRERHERNFRRKSRSRSQEDRKNSRPSERDTRNPVVESRRRQHVDPSTSGQNSRQDSRSANQRERQTNPPSESIPTPWSNEPPKPKEESRPKEDVKKEKPNFEKSGKLLEDTNMVNGVVITYAQPPEARIPKVRWRLYPFKGDEALSTMYIHRQSAYLLGRDRRVVDIPLDHPSCSKQHAVIQYRLIPVEKEDGTVVRRVKPYVLDLNSGNGTLVNGKKIEPQRYVELLEKDVIKFGFSSREYVMLHEGSKDDEYHSDDDNNRAGSVDKD